MLDVSGFEKYERIIRLFEKISEIPRGSGNTRPIADFLEEFASSRGLEYVRDSSDNIIIRKPATEDKKGSPAIIFQGHSDIVAEKTPDCKKDMTREGLDLYRDGDFIRARGTTLGADDGVALAYGLAVLDGMADSHPDFEALFTSNEETGLFGAMDLDGSLLRGRLMVNLDSGAARIFTVGCAGGMNTVITLPIKREAPNGRCYRLTVSGLVGGHSGCDIHRGRLNATHILAEALSRLGDIRIAELSGGTKDNAIPRSAECVFYADSDLSAVACEVSEDIKAKCSSIEKDIEITFAPAVSTVEALDGESSRRAVSLLCALPTGILKMSEELEDQVETSLNLGITELTEKELSLSFYLRSSHDSANEETHATLKRIADEHGAVTEVLSSYPGWAYNPISPLREAMISLWREFYDGEPAVTTIHAGLECGIIAAKVEGLDCVSIGPNTYSLHTTEEHLSISSYTRMWDYLKELLKRI
jgi:dipeptidase D